MSIFKHRPTESELAFELVQRIKTTIYSLTGHVLELGELLYTFKEKQYWRALNYDYWKEFLGDPDISLPVSTADIFIRIYRKFVRELGVPKENLIDKDYSKLLVILPMVDDENKGEWLAKATALSKSDLITEVKEARGEPLSLPKPKETHHSLLVRPVSPKEYVEYVESCDCIFHPGRPAEKHHYPKTKGAGAKDWKVIPLCRECHSEYHRDPYEFEYRYRNQILDFFYNLIVEEEEKCLNQKVK